MADRSANSMCSTIANLANFVACKGSTGDALAGNGRGAASGTTRHSHRIRHAVTRSFSASHGKQGPATTYAPSLDARRANHRGCRSSGNNTRLQSDADTFKDLRDRMPMPDPDPLHQSFTQASASPASPANTEMLMFMLTNACSPTGLRRSKYAYWLSKTTANQVAHPFCMPGQVTPLT